MKSSNKQEKNQRVKNKKKGEKKVSHRPKGVNSPGKANCHHFYPQMKEPGREGMSIDTRTKDKGYTEIENPQLMFGHARIMYSKDNFIPLYVTRSHSHTNRTTESMHRMLEIDGNSKKGAVENKK